MWISSMVEDHCGVMQAVLLLFVPGACSAAVRCFTAAVPRNSPHGAPFQLVGSWAPVRRLWRVGIAGSTANGPAEVAVTEEERGRPCGWVGGSEPLKGLGSPLDSKRPRTWAHRLSGLRPLRVHVAPAPSHPLSPLPETLSSWRWRRGKDTGRPADGGVCVGEVFHTRSERTKKEG